MKKIILNFLRKNGYELKKITEDDFYPREATKKDKEIINYVLNLKDNYSSAPLTMISPKCLWAAISSVKYTIENDIDGDIVECGVWRGGCSIAMALKLKEYNSNKKVWMFDTFQGMTAPTEKDTHHSNGVNAILKFNNTKKDSFTDWCYSPLEEVTKNLEKAKVKNYTRIIKGDVLKTLQSNENIPNQISLLRLDTDWYESTKIEMEILFPLLSEKGILLVDDYGHWDGSRKAVDEYLKSEKNKTLKKIFWVTDYSGRALIKIAN